jgi:hypothetical protein
MHAYPTRPREGFGPELLETPPAPPFSIDTRRVVIRLHGGEDIEVGRTEGREGAIAIARETVARVEDAASRGEWPVVDDRFLRPGAIVSIDVQRNR